jgi:hypothetical protein
LVEHQEIFRFKVPVAYFVWMHVFYYLDHLRKHVPCVFLWKTPALLQPLEQLAAFAVTKIS